MEKNWGGATRPHPDFSSLHQCPCGQKSRVTRATPLPIAAMAGGCCHDPGIRDSCGDAAERAASYRDGGSCRSVVEAGFHLPCSRLPSGSSGFRKGLSRPGKIPDHHVRVLPSVCLAPPPWLPLTSGPPEGPSSVSQADKGRFREFVVRCRKTAGDRPCLCVG